MSKKQNFMIKFLRLFQFCVVIIIIIFNYFYNNNMTMKRTIGYYNHILSDKYYFDRIIPIFSIVICILSLIFVINILKGIKHRNQESKKFKKIDLLLIILMVIGISIYNIFDIGNIVTYYFMLIFMCVLLIFQVWITNQKLQQHN